MALQLTKLGRDVYAPVTAGGVPRGADMGDAAVHSTEIEKLIEALVAGAGGITLTDDVIYALNGGAGTANAVKATATGAMSAAPGAQLITVNFTAANTGPMTLSINGETPRPLVTNTGVAIEAGYVSAGMSALVQIDSAGNYRLFSYGDATAIQAAAEAILVEAEAARDAALGAVPNVFSATRTALTALDTTTITAAYLKEAGREGQFVWRVGDYSAQIAADPSEAIYIKADGIAATVGAWVRNENWRIFGISSGWLGLDGTSTADQTDKLDALFALADFLGAGAVITAGTYLVNVDKPFQGEHGDTWCAFYIRDKMKIYAVGDVTLKIKDGVSTDANPVNYNMFSGNAIYEDLGWYGIRFDMGGKDGANTISPDRYNCGKVNFFTGSSGLLTWPGNTPVSGKKVRFQSTKTLPAELAQDTDYYITTVFGDGSFYVSATAGGAKIEFSTAGDGTRIMKEVGSYNGFNCAAIYIGGITAEGFGSGVDARVNGMRLKDCKFENSPGVNCILTGSGYSGFTYKSNNVRIEDCDFYNNGLDSADHSSIFLWADESFITGCHFDHPVLSQGIRGPVCAFELHGIGNRATNNFVDNYVQGCYSCGTSHGVVQGNVIFGNIFRVLWRGVVTWQVAPVNNGLEDLMLGPNEVLIYSDDLTSDRTSLPKSGYTISADDGPLRSVKVRGTITSFPSNQGVVGVIAYSKSTGTSVMTDLDVSDLMIKGATIGIQAGGYIKTLKAHGNIMTGFWTGEPYTYSTGIVTSSDLVAETISLVGNVIGDGEYLPGEGMHLQGQSSSLNIDLNSVVATGTRINESIIANRRRGMQATTFADLTAVGTRWPSPDDGAFAWCSDGSEQGTAGSKYTVDGWRYAGVGGWIARRALSGN